MSKAPRPNYKYKMTGDEYYRRAKEEGYRARSAYKLIEIDDKFDIFTGDEEVLDLGAAPGSWLQVAKERGENVVGIDLKPIDPIDGVDTVQGDIKNPEILESLKELNGGNYDIVLSDASPNISGNWSLDHARSVELARNALDIARETLNSGGYLVVKVFQGDMMDELRDEISCEFGSLATFKPDSSRDESSEVYLVGLGFLATPISIGDVKEVEITDRGEEGDGVARIDDFVVFVPNVDVGEIVEVEIVDVKEGYAFAEKTD